MREDGHPSKDPLRRAVIVGFVISYFSWAPQRIARAEGGYYKISS